MNHWKAYALPRIALGLLLATWPARPLPLAAAETDQIFLVSTRALGTRCAPDQMASGLHCEQRVLSDDEHWRWQDCHWTEIASRPMPTIIYIHGNRMPSGYDRQQGLDVYQTLARRSDVDAPARFIIWSWPSEQIRRPVRDYKVKAARTRPAGWQLAWAISDLPADTPLALVGYSYGARIVTGALHLLAGGRLGDLEIAARSADQRPPVDVALIAAAADAAWIRPGGFHGRALSQVDRMVLLTNRLDPAMRFYHLTFGRHVQPLGYAGLIDGRPRGPLWSVDLSDQIGRSHALDDYLRASSVVAQVWPAPEQRQLAQDEQPAAGASPRVEQPPQNAEPAPTVAREVEPAY